MTHLTKTTRSTKIKDIKRNWHVFDAKGKILGRFVTEITQYLMGKHKVNYVSHLDMGDNVIVINSLNLKVTGRKEEQKVYTRYSGFPGGLKELSYKRLKEIAPREIIRHSVWGMLPKNKLRKKRIKRLHIFLDDKHTFEDKLMSS